jgi:hypothetical protein
MTENFSDETEYFLGSVGVYRDRRYERNFQLPVLDDDQNSILAVGRESNQAPKHPRIQALPVLAQPTFGKSSPGQRQALVRSMCLRMPATACYCLVAAAVALVRVLLPVTFILISLVPRRAAFACLPAVGR